MRGYNRRRLPERPTTPSCDPYLGRDLAEPPRDWVPNVRVERLPGVSHWVQNDAADRVNSLLIDFLLPT